MLELPIGAKVVKHYPYRTARVTDYVIIIDALHCGEEGTKEMRRFHDEVAKDAGQHMADNHECYAVEANGKRFYYLFSDWSLYVGTGIKEYRW